MVGLLAGWTLAPAQEAAGVIKPAPVKFDKVPGAPDCLTAAVQDGDPAHGASVFVLKFAAGCTVPWHWHTPNEQLMMVIDTASFQMKDGKAVLLRARGHGLAPSHHVHRFGCASPCTAFLRSDGPFDIHYVDAAGTEIPPEQALKSAPAAATPP